MRDFSAKRHPEVFAESAQGEIDWGRHLFVFVHEPDGSLHGAKHPRACRKKSPAASKPPFEEGSIIRGVVRHKLCNLVHPSRSRYLVHGPMPSKQLGKLSAQDIIVLDDKDMGRVHAATLAKYG